MGRVVVMPPQKKPLFKSAEVEGWIVVIVGCFFIGLTVVGGIMGGWVLLVSALN